MGLIFFLVVAAATSFFKDVSAFNIVLQLQNSNETENITLKEDYEIDKNTLDNLLHFDFSDIGYRVFKKKIAQAMEIYENFMKINSVTLNISQLIKNETSEKDYSNSNTNRSIFLKIEDIHNNLVSNIESPSKDKLTENYDKIAENITELITMVQNNTAQISPLVEISNENHTTIIEMNLTASSEVENIQSYQNNSKEDNYYTNNTEINLNASTSHEEDNVEITEANPTVNNEVNETISHETNSTTNEVTLILNEDNAPDNEGNDTTNGAPKKIEVAPDGIFSKVSNSLTNLYHSLTSWF